MQDHPAGTDDERLRQLLWVAGGHEWETLEPEELEAARALFADPLVKDLLRAIFAHRPEYWVWYHTMYLESKANNKEAGLA